MTWRRRVAAAESEGTAVTGPSGPMSSSPRLPPLTPRWRRSARRLGRALLTGLVVAVAGVGFWAAPVGNQLEETVGLHWLFRWRGPLPPPSDVAVVTIDRRSAVALGLDARLEIWPREIHARLVDTLAAAGVAAIAYDIAFEKPRDPAADAALASAIAAAGRVVLFERLDRVQEPAGGVGLGRPADAVDSHRRYPPLPPFAAAAAALAPFPLPKVPERVAQVWTFKPAAGMRPTLPAAAFQLAARDVLADWLALLAEAGALRLVGASSLGDAASVEALMVALRGLFLADPDLAERVEALAESRGAGMTAGQERHVRALTRLYAGEASRYLNFYGPAGTIRTIPIHALVDGSAAGPREKGLDLAGRVVFVGAAELFHPEQRDGFFTVFTRDDGVDLSGVEIAATAFANIVDDGWVRAADDAVAIAVLAGFGLVAGVLVFLAPPLIGIPAGIATAAGFTAAAHALFAANGLWLPVMTPLVIQTPLALVVGLLVRFLALQERWRRYVVQVVPRDIVRQVRLESFVPGAGDREVQAVCLATDAARYALFAEALGPAAGQRILSALLNRIIAAFEPHDVDFCEISVDGVMATWVIAASEGDLEARRRACLAALAALEATDQFNRANLPAQQLPVRIGLTVGQAFVGNVGPGDRLSYGTRGDTPITASRLESLNKVLGTRILAAAAVTAGIDEMLVRPLGDFVPAGKNIVVPVVELRCRAADATSTDIDLCRRFGAALERFRASDFAAATALLSAVREHFPDDGPTSFLLNQCEGFRKAPPPKGESPTFVMQQK